MRSTAAPTTPPAKEWAEKIRSGDIRTAARACSLIENEDPQADSILAAIYPYTGRAMVVGVTGPPGAGKSTLLSCLVEEAVGHSYKVGVIAVDPSSPISGGALLADRLRIDTSDRSQVYIRSLATRGSLGGLAAASFGILRVMEAMGKALIFVETVGAGQNEVAVSSLATTTVFVTVPNLGDDIQALKAGILEVCDIFAVNKSDLGNAEVAVSQLRTVLTMREFQEAGSEPVLPNSSELSISWRLPVMAVSAHQKKGVAQLFSAIMSHHQQLAATRMLEQRRRRQVSAEIELLLERKLSVELKSLITEKVIDSLMSHEKSPHALAAQLVARQVRRAKK